MIHIWSQRLRRWRRRVSRSEWLVHLLGLPRVKDPETTPGLIMIQIDGLPRTQLECAFREGNAPFLRKLFREEEYRLTTFYSGLPSSTPAVQAEIFYGIPAVVPSWGFRRDGDAKPVTMMMTDVASTLQAELESRNPGLLVDGVAYADIYTGGANESHFCASRMGWGELLEKANPIKLALIVLLNIFIVFRIITLAAVELVVAILDFVHGVVTRYEFKEELINIPARVGVGIILREILTRGTMMDIARGVPIIHLNYLGYDEQAHRRGPSSAMAHWSLKGIDACVKRIWRAARRSEDRDYQIWVYSDHGQEEVTPYYNENGRTIQEAVAAIFEQKWVKERYGRDRGVQLERVSLLGGRRIQRFLKPRVPAAEEDNLVVAKGPTGHVYPPAKLSATEENRLAKALVREANVPIVFAKDRPGRAKAWTAEGVHLLPEDAAKVLGENHPLLEPVTEDLIKLIHHPWAGAFLLSGHRPNEKSMSFPMENGSHAGPGPEETRGFALLPQHVSIAKPAKGYIRPLELRAAAMRLRRFGAHCRVDPEEGEAAVPARQGLRIMTYNVHGCVGMDGRIALDRLARLIEQHNPDVVALQELDVNRSRSGGIDQARALAHAMEMDVHFHPALRIAEEQYGDAILSRLPMRLVKAGSLPTPPRAETRGALWVELDVDGTPVQLINTHFGLGRNERLAQAQAILGPDWLSHPDCRGARVLCGDFNSMPRSGVYRLLTQGLQDVRACSTMNERRFRGTFMGLWHLDYVFVSEEFDVSDSCVSCTSLARVASDHLPVVVDLQLKAAKTDKPAVLPTVSVTDAGVEVSGEALGVAPRPDEAQGS